MTAPGVRQICIALFLAGLSASAIAPAAVRADEAGRPARPERPDPVYAEAASRRASGDYAGAEEMLRARLAGDKDDACAMLELGLVYQDKGDKDGALKMFKKAVAAGADEPLAHFFLGRSYFLMQREAAAVEEFNAYRAITQRLLRAGAVSRDAYIGNLHYISGVYFTIKEYRRAKDVIDEILKLDPKDQMAMYNLGIYYYYSAERNRSKSYRYFKNTIDLDPQSSAAKKAAYAIEFIRNNPDPRVSADFSFLEQEYR